MADNNNLINLVDLAKPAEKLIDKICEATGAVFGPWQTKRMAQAEAEAATIKALAALDINDEVQRRAMARMINEETRKQINIENVTRKSLPLLKEDAEPKNIDDDWLSHFFEKCRTVSNDEMQTIWARILAGEANIPNTFSKNTLSILSTLERKDAELFTVLSGYTWNVGGMAIPLIFDVSNEIYTRHGVNFASLEHLASIGLITFNSFAGYQLTKQPKPMMVIHFGKLKIFEFPNDTNDVQIGKARFTQAGLELSQICTPAQEPDFVDYVVAHWTSMGAKVIFG